MKIMKSLVTVALLLALCLSLVACSVSKEDVVGTWTGTYEISGRRVELHPNGEKGHTTPYEYKGGKLVNNDHEFTKK